MGAHLIWWWARCPNGTPSDNQAFYGDFTTQPQLVEAWGRTMVELNRLAPYVILFPQLERKARILFSEASCIQSVAVYLEEVDKLHESLYFLDYPAGFITENQIGTGGLKDCDLLIIPSPTYVKEDTVLKIREYLKKGGKIAVSGDEALKYDEYGRERDVSCAGMAVLTGTTLRENSEQLDKIMEDAGIERPVRIVDREGKHPWKVEARTAVKDGRKIVYIINLGINPAEITIHSKGKEKTAKNLISLEETQIGGWFTLQPMEIRLLELN